MLGTVPIMRNPRLVRWASAQITSSTRIGWIGTGIMGRWMCKHLMDAGYKATVFNRTLAKTKALELEGALVANSPAEVAANSDIVFSIVGYPHDVREVYLGSGKVIESMRPGGIIVDMTTSEPGLAKEIYAAAQKRGISSIDAPVSGGDVGARNAQLTIMGGGDKDVFESITPLLKPMSKAVTHFGEAGKGQHAKMMNQILIASGMVAVVEGLIYGHKAGLDVTTAINLLSQGAAGSWSLANYGPRMVNRNFEPGFVVEHFIKDMGIALNEANRMGLALPGLALANQLYIAMRNQGLGRKGTQGLLLALETINGIPHRDPASVA